MGEIRFVGTGESRGYPCLVCKKRIVSPGKTRGYPYPVCKKRLVSPGKTHGYPYPVFTKIVLVSLFFEFKREVVGWCDDTG